MNFLEDYPSKLSTGTIVLYVFLAALGIILAFYMIITIIMIRKNTEETSKYLKEILELMKANGAKPTDTKATGQKSFSKAELAELYAKNKTEPTKTASTSVPVDKDTRNLKHY